ncbi:MAG: ABC transporter permease [Gemmatimonadaceae bacterium]|nr:ABC transporter permease [Gemmatimonadaceae bacterium]MDQ3244111.1 FtsX-like permease family protein [Gemmatimonadota bacterium]
MRFTLAWASLRRHTSRTLLATLGVAVAAAMLLDMVMMSTGMRESFRELLLSRGFQLRLAPKGTLPFDTDATMERSSEIIAVLRENPSIVTVSPVLGATIHVPIGGRVVTSAALGVNPEVQGDYELLAGRDPVGAGEIAVNDEFLAATGLKPGDAMDVATGYDPQLRTYSGSRRLVISGRVRFLYGAVNQLATAIELETLRTMGGESRADDTSLFMLKVRNDSEVEAARDWIERRIPSVSAISTSTALAQVDERLSYFRQLALILGTVSLFVGFLLVTTLVTVSVNERIGEIAVMRALGVSRAHVVQQIVLEGVAISVAGAIAGLALGLVTAQYLNGILSSFPGLPVAIDFFLFQPRSAWTALGLLTLSGILAGVYPSFRAASLPIATTLREDAIA